MTAKKTEIELLSPAKNLEFAKEAILHGADAVYIGGPMFGARAKVGNSVSDIAALCEFAHPFQAKVLIALNTLLHDAELEEANKIAWQCYEAGADALIIQDMGLLETDLPPMALHASTQTDIRTPAKAKFLEEVGFSQIVLARELSLDQIREIASQTNATLEYFVHGALCVSYSGLCNLSYAKTGRSANRGECSQLCRLPYSLFDEAGNSIGQNKHFLSLKDNNQSENIKALIEAGIRSFKIEGRLKDLSYVKNVTAYYRQCIDQFLEHNSDFKRSSLGESHYTFTPDLEQSFNRGFTDYFLHERKENIGAFDTPKFSGKEIGALSRVSPHVLEIKTKEQLSNGDGISCFDEEGELFGVRINRVEALPNGYRLFLAAKDHQRMGALKLGTLIYRNHDQKFENILEKKSAERLVPVSLCFSEIENGYALEISDETGLSDRTEIITEKQYARDPEKGLAALTSALSRLGGTIYQAKEVSFSDSINPPDHIPFVPLALINAVRRSLIESFDQKRKVAYVRPARKKEAANPPKYPESVIGYLGNVLNQKANAFFEKHGVVISEPALESNQETMPSDEVSLMITKHCVRYSLNLCPKQVKGIRPEPLVLKGLDEALTLRFDCKACEMHVVGSLKKLKGKKRIMLKDMNAR